MDDFDAECGALDDLGHRCDLPFGHPPPHSGAHGSNGRRQWTDAQPLLAPEVWKSAVDETIPPGVIRIDGFPYPLVEFSED